jgi:high-affinity nickel-transport protein
MLSSVSILLLGFLLGMRHATDADHVVAVTTIVSEECSVRRASGIGALWGIGHSITILLVGGAIVSFRLTIPPRLGLALEFSVALMLIALGGITLARRRIGSARSVTRPVAVGVVHGLAGSAFVALVVLAAVPQTWLALVYLGLFAAGNHRGDGRDHRGDRGSLGAERATLCRRSAVRAGGERRRQPCLRIDARSPRRGSGSFRGGAELDPALKGVRPTRNPRRSTAGVQSPFVAAFMPGIAETRATCRGAGLGTRTMCSCRS